MLQQPHGPSLLRHDRPPRALETTRSRATRMAPQREPPLAVMPARAMDSVGHHEVLKAPPTWPQVEAVWHLGMLLVPISGGMSWGTGTRAKHGIVTVHLAGATGISRHLHAGLTLLIERLASFLLCTYVSSIRLGHLKHLAFLLLACCWSSADQ